MRRVLFDDVDADGNSAVIGCIGGRHAFVVSAIAAGTVTLYAADESGVFVSLGTDTALTAPGIVNFDLPPGFNLRATISGGGGSAGVTAAVVGP